MKRDDEAEAGMDLDPATDTAYTLTYIVMVVLIIIGLLLYQ